MTNEVGMFGPSPIKPEKLLRELIRGVKEHDSGRTLNKRGNKSWTCLLYTSSGLRLAWNDAGAMRTAMEERLSVVR